MYSQACVCHIRSDWWYSFVLDKFQLGKVKKMETNKRHIVYTSKWGDYSTYASMT